MLGTLLITYPFHPRVFGFQVTLTIAHQRGLFLASELQRLPVDTVDGSESPRSPVKVGSLSHDLQRFFTSKVVQDFFHRHCGYPHDLQIVTMSQPFLAGISSTINLSYDKKGLAPHPQPPTLPKPCHWIF